MFLTKLLQGLTVLSLALLTLWPLPAGETIRIGSRRELFVDARRSASLGQEHEGEQAGDLTVVWQELTRARG